MRTVVFLSMILLAGCDPVATSEHVRSPQSGSLVGESDHDSESGSSAGVASEQGESSEGASRGTGGQVLPHPEPRRASPQEATKVKVFFSGTDVSAPIEMLGVVDVHEPASSDEHGLEIMRERAAAMHADAVVGVEFHRDDKSFTDLSGLAVRYNDLLRGRRYDVIQTIRVHEGEGKDGDAMAELQRRASALNADLIIDIAWHDNDAEKDGTYLSGTAIRYRNE